MAAAEEMLNGTVDGFEAGDVRALAAEGRRDCCQRSARMRAERDSERINRRDRGGIDRREDCVVEDGELRRGEGG